MSDKPMIRIIDVSGINKPEQRAAICYVGRRWAGWPASPWGNPFRSGASVIGCLERFRLYALKQPESWLASLWECCERGNKPLGCWCTEAVYPGDAPWCCHAQVLAALLHQRFVRPEETRKRLITGMQRIGDDLKRAMEDRE